MNLAFNAYDELVTDGATSHAYDALNRLVTAGTRTLAYTGTSADLISDGVFAYTHTPDGTPLGTRQGSTASIAITDRHTDLVGLINPATGAVTGSRQYDPFGGVSAQTGLQPGLGYQHQWTDPTTGNVNMGARWYQPGTGTFTSRDTAPLDPRDLPNANRHTYANANPLTNTDPTGHYAYCALGVAAGPAAPAAVGGCLGVTLLGAAMLAIWAGSVTAADAPHPGTGPARAPAPTRPVAGQRADSGQYDWIGATRPRAPGPPTTGPAPRAKSPTKTTTNTRGRTATGTNRTSTVLRPAAVDERAARVIANALRPAPRPIPTVLIASNVQHQIDAANNATPINLGTLPTNTTDQPHQPDNTRDTGPGIPAPLPPAQAHLDDTCHTGGHTQSDAFGNQHRTAGTWEDDCARADDDTDTAGEATVFLDRGAAHASIRVDFRGVSLHTEQEGTDGHPAKGQYFNGELSDGPILEIHVQLPDAARAQAYQRATEGHIFGLYDGRTRSCVTYCADVLRAGGVEGIPNETNEILRWLWRHDRGRL